MRVLKSRNIIKAVIIAGLAVLGSDLAGQSLNRFNTSTISENLLSIKLLNFEYPGDTLTLSKPLHPTVNYSGFTKKHFGIICLAEQKLQASSNIPFRFRLGSVDYVNWLESKPLSSFYFIQN